MSDPVGQCFSCRWWDRMVDQATSDKWWKELESLQQGPIKSLAPEQQERRRELLSALDRAEHGHCRRHAPSARWRFGQPVPEEQPDDGPYGNCWWNRDSAHWPITFTEDWCGEYQLNPNIKLYEETA